MKRLYEDMNSLFTLHIVSYGPGNCVEIRQTHFFSYHNAELNGNVCVTNRQCVVVDIK